MIIFFFAIGANVCVYRMKIHRVQIEIERLCVRVSVCCARTNELSHFMAMGWVLNFNISLMFYPKTYEKSKKKNEKTFTLCKIGYLIVSTMFIV